MDSNADCTRLVVDGWLELEVREPEEALRVLSKALTLRAEWERLLSAQLGRNATGGAAAQGLPRKVLEKLSEGLVRYLLYTEVLTERCTVSPHILSRSRDHFRILHSFICTLGVSYVPPAPPSPRSVTACSDSQLYRPKTCTSALRRSLSCVA